MYDNNNRGAAFPQDGSNPKAPAYKGNITVDGKEKVIKIWNKTSQAGKPYLSILVEEPFRQQPVQAPAFEEAADLPF